MRPWKALRLAMFAAIVVCPAAAGAEPASSAEAASARQIDQVLTEIQVALLKVQNEAAAQTLPKLANVSLELETEFEYGAGGELNLYVVELGAKREHQNTQRVALTLVPPKPYSEQPIASGKISESLSTAILAAAKGIGKAKSRKPPLVLSKLEAEIKFVVKTSGEGGIRVEILPITAGLKGEISKTATQTLTVTFEASDK